MNRPPACLRLPDEKGNNDSYWSGLTGRTKFNVSEGINFVQQKRSTNNDTAIENNNNNYVQL